MSIGCGHDGSLGECDGLDFLAVRGDNAGDLDEVCISDASVEQSPIKGIQGSIPFGGTADEKIGFGNCVNHGLVLRFAITVTYFPEQDLCKRLLHSARALMAEGSTKS